MRLFTTLILFSTACSGCRKEIASHATQSREAQTVELRQKLGMVTTADGISKAEAQIIAECYFHQNVGCGAFTGIRDGGDYWIVDGAFGYAGMPIKGFHIDKRTGKVLSPIGPSYASPLQIFP